MLLAAENMRKGKKGAFKEATPDKELFELLMARNDVEEAFSELPLKDVK
jgi:hypothetical protein